MTGRTYEDGIKRGIRMAITRLHKRALEMNDPHAKTIINTAAFHLGVHLNELIQQIDRTSASEPETVA